MVEGLHYSSRCDLEKIDLSVAREEKKVLRSKIQLKRLASPSGREVLHFYRLHRSQPHVQRAYTDRSRGSAPQNPLRTSNPMLLVHGRLCMTYKTPNMEQDTAHIIFIFRINV